ncbi:hypothetical protein ACOMHN_063006 [Nucella lapillus]
MSGHRKFALGVCGLQVLLSCIGVVLATKASERESESVEVTFYQLSKSEWSDAESAFKTLAAAEAASYCASNSECGLSAGFSFTSSQVGIASGPTEESKSLKIRFYIDFPAVTVVSSTSATRHVINAATTAKILTNVRTAAESAVGRDITYIGDEFYSIEPDALMNKIVIPAAVAVLIIICILAVVLHVWSKGKEKEEKKKVMIAERQRRKKSARVSPAHAVVREGKQYGPLCDSEQGLSKLHTNGQTTPTNNNNRMTAARSNTLPPLPTTPPAKKAKTRKDRKSERKRKKEEKTDQENEAMELKKADEGESKEMKIKISTLKETREVIVVEEACDPEIVL